MDGIELLGSSYKPNSTPSSNNETVTSHYTWSTAMQVFFYLDYTLIGIGFTCNMFGISLLVRARGRTLQNQNIFMIHLSCIAVLCLVVNGIAIYMKARRVSVPEWYVVVFYVSYIAYITNLIFLTLDRLIFIVFYRTYYKIITRSRALALLVLTWVTAISYGLSIAYSNLTTLNGYDKYSAYVYNGIVVMVSTVVYVAISVKLYMTSRKVRTSSNVISRRKYVVPLFIVVSFFLSEVVPSIIVDVVPVPKSNFDMMVVALIGINVFTYICDPIIYVFVQPKVRKVMVASIRNIAQRDVAIASCDLQHVDETFE